MRKMYVPYLIVFVLCLGTASCGNSGEDKETTSESSKENPKTDSKSSSAGLSVAAAKEFLSADAANSGKEVTVTAFSWGSQNRMGGEIGLNLGDKKLEGFQQATFTCIFSKEQEAEIKAIAKDATVTVSGKISKGSGGIQLNECRLIK
jgi:hypothetical protein